MLQRAAEMPTVTSTLKTTQAIAEASYESSCVLGGIVQVQVRRDVQISRCCVPYFRTEDWIYSAANHHLSVVPLPGWPFSQRFHPSFHVVGSLRVPCGRKDQVWHLKVAAGKTVRGKTARDGFPCGCMQPFSRLYSATSSSASSHLPEELWLGAQSSWPTELGRRVGTQTSMPPQEQPPVTTSACLHPKEMQRCGS